MRREDDEQLWDFLGHNPEPKVSPFFARNVLRRVRQEQSERPRSWFSLRRLVPATGVALAVLGTVIFVRYQTPKQQSPPESPVDPVITSIDVQDYEVVADLDNLLASDETSPWDENSTL
ncbi:MAG: hypothetical protein QOE73_1935 [Verrucomicrobiota bacterium]